MIPYGKQSIDEEEIAAVCGVLRSPNITQGPAIRKFEQKLGGFVSSDYCVSFSSATAALHAACKAIDLGTGGLLWTSPNSFVASANCGVYCGAEVDFVDIDPLTYNMCMVALKKKLEQAADKSLLPDVVIPVHFAGQPCDMRALWELKQQYGFKIIEDASHAIGAKFEGNHVGNCEHSDITVFSFHPVKIITTGEGGAATTNDESLVEKLSTFRSHGITRNEECFVKPTDGPWDYQMLDLGFNYRMTDIQAALGTVQLSKIDKFIASRKKAALTYFELLARLPLQLPCLEQLDTSSWHLFPILVPDRTGNQRLRLFNKLREAKIGVNVHYIPIHTQPFYEKLGFKSGDFPVSEQYYARTISLPIFYSLSHAQQEYITGVVREFFDSGG